MVAFKIFNMILLGVGIQAKIAVSLNGTGLRRLTNNLLEQYFLPYGCYCHFDSNLYNKPGKGRGQPVDEWDANCKSLMDGYECAVIDAIARGENDCEPWAVNYPNLGTGMASSMVAQMCALISNGDLCKQDACIVETIFVNKVGDMVLGGSNASPGFTDVTAISQTNMHSEGFNPKTDCDGKNGPNSRDKQCCGNIPNRIPYRVMDSRACCVDANGVGKTYDNLHNVCCNDGSIGSFGSDCDA